MQMHLPIINNSKAICSAPINTPWQTGFDAKVITRRHPRDAKRFEHKTSTYQRALFQQSNIAPKPCSYIPGSGTKIMNR